MEQFKHQEVACPICGRPLRISTSRSNFGKVTSCTLCRQRRWYERNKENILATMRLYYKQTAKKRRKNSRQYWYALSKKERFERSRIQRLRHRYGITPQDYDHMFQDQKGLCFLCGNQPAKNRPLSVDHCHKENRTRKLLCEPCNRALGFIERDPQWVSRAIAYLGGEKEKENVRR